MPTGTHVADNIPPMHGNLVNASALILSGISDDILIRYLTSDVFMLAPTIQFLALQMQPAINVNSVCVEDT